MIIHYDRVPTLPRGRHGSRVQRANHKRRTEWQRAKSLARNWPELGAPAWASLIRTLPASAYDGKVISGYGLAHYDMTGKPIGMVQASFLLKDIDARRIGLDHIGGYEVSTVHMPDVAYYTGDGRPLMFETMVFDDTGMTVGRWLTTTKELAKQQHEWVCHRVRQEAQGICPHSGESFRDCKRTDLCDCFDYPEHEHYRGDVS
jgi:hypothetical protein